MHPKSFILTVGLARINAPRVCSGLGKKKKSQLGLAGQERFSLKSLKAVGRRDRSKTNVQVPRGLWRVKNRLRNVKYCIVVSVGCAHPDGYPKLTS